MSRELRAVAVVVWAGLAAGCGLGLTGEQPVTDSGADDPVPSPAIEAGVSDASASPDVAAPPDTSQSVDANGLDGVDAATIDDAGNPIVDGASTPDVEVPIDAEVDAPSNPSDAGSPHDGGGDENGAAPDSGSQCNFSGTWASKLTIAVSWVPQGLTSVVLAPGTGTIEQWVKSTRVQTGTSTSDTATVCGISLPDFSGTNIFGGETYGVRFPPALFDSNDIPTFTISGTLSDSSPNASFSTTASAALIGLTLPSPTTSPWPTPVTTAVDTDHDGNLGVTIDTATGPDGDGGNYAQIPVDFAKDRANELYVVIRQVTLLNGGASDCDHFSGSVSIPRIPASPTGKYAIDSHIIGCQLVDGGNCGLTQTAIADGTQPIFSPAGTTAFTSVRIDSSASCSAVRRALP